jgi:hypothetical protein
VAVTPRLPSYIFAGEVTVADGLRRIPLSVSPDAPMTSPFAETYASRGGSGEAGLVVSAAFGAHEARAEVELEEPLQIVPAQSVRIEPQAVVLPLAQLAASSGIEVHVDGAQAPVSIEAPPGVRIEKTSVGMRVDASTALVAGCNDARRCEYRAGCRVLPSAGEGWRRARVQNRFHRLPTCRPASLCGAAGPRSSGARSCSACRREGRLCRRRQ